MDELELTEHSSHLTDGFQRWGFWPFTFAIIFPYQVWCRSDGNSLRSSVLSLLFAGQQPWRKVDMCGEGAILLQQGWRESWIPGCRWRCICNGRSRTVLSSPCLTTSPILPATLRHWSSFCALQWHSIEITGAAVLHQLNIRLHVINSASLEDPWSSVSKQELAIPLGKDFLQAEIQESVGVILCCEFLWRNEAFWFPALKKLL